AQSLGRISRQDALPAQEAAPRPHRSQAPRHGTLRVSLLVEPGKIRAKGAGVQLIRLLDRRGLLFAEKGQGLGQVLPIRLDGVRRSVAFQGQMTQELGEGFFHRWPPALKSERAKEATRGRARSLVPAPFGS